MSRVQIACRLGLSAAVLCLWLCGCQESSSTSETADVEAVSDLSATSRSHDGARATQQATKSEVDQFCGACHVVPQPESFPRQAWYEEVGRGFEFYFDSGRRDIRPPPQTSVVQYYQSRAPESLDDPEMPEAPESGLSFHRVGLQAALAEPPRHPPAISFVSLLSHTADDTSLLISDMRSGWFGKLSVPRDVIGNDRASQTIPVTPPCQHCVACPAAICSGEFTGNDMPDLVVADLGSFQPEDHRKGQVVMIPDFESGTHPPIQLLGDIGRVADVQVADFNQDGRPDLVVAEFGWHTTGGLHLLLAKEQFKNASSFTHHVLDTRPGTIHVIPVDLNHDGRLDIVALLSQEYEQVVAYLQETDGRFTATPLYVAPDPSWGSSGIVLQDMDQDGDQDILYTNGDAFDSYLVKPYHGIRWLRNEGNLTFTPHEIGAMPGVHRALPVDLDLDGDLDVVASALLPEKTRASLRSDLRHALVWFEQTSPGQFERHVIERDQPVYAAALVTDINGDQRPDIVTGCFMESAPQDRDDVRIFINQSR